MATQGVDERRDRRRHRVSGLSGILKRSIDARVLDLSVLGMAIETGSWLRVGSEYRLQMVHGERSVEYEARVVWCRLIGSQPTGSGDFLPVYRAGLKFLAPQTDDTETLRSLLEENAVVSVDTRLAGRFKVRRERSVNVSYRHEFEVLAIGRRELVLQAELVPETGAHFDLELGEGDDLVLATVVVERLIRTPRSSASKLVCRILEVDPQTHGSLERLIRSHLDEPTTFLGNESTGVFHDATCRHAPGADRVHFRDREAAVAAGFKPGSCCSP